MNKLSCGGFSRKRKKREENFLHIFQPEIKIFGEREWKVELGLCVWVWCIYNHFLHWQSWWEWMRHFTWAKGPRRSHRPSSFRRRVVCPMCRAASDGFQPRVDPSTSSRWANWWPASGSAVDSSTPEGDRRPLRSHSMTYHCPKVSSWMTFQAESCWCAVELHVVFQSSRVSPHTNYSARLGPESLSGGWGHVSSRDFREIFRVSVETAGVIYLHWFSGSCQRRAARSRNL